MARERDRLTVKKIESLKRSGYWCDGGGLYLQVTSRRTKSWVFRFKSPKWDRVREMGLGPYSDSDVTLKEARDAASHARRLLRDGIDPIDERKNRLLKAKARDKTFKECADAYINAHKAGWRNDKHASQWENTLRDYVHPKLGTVAVGTIDTEAVLGILRPIWTEKTETATRVRQRIEAVLDWATAKGYREGENPARWRGHLQNLLPKATKVKRVKHHPALPYNQIADFIKSLREEEATAAQSLEFVILTAARTGEVINAKPEEFDLQNALWVVPGERMKSGREHRVPLSPRAVEIVRSRIDGEFVFGGRRKSNPLSNIAMLMLLRRMGRSDLTVHGFRSTFRDWAAELSNFPRELAEAALAHVLKDKTEGAYQRGDLLEKRRLMMLAWANHCDSPAEGGKVVGIGKTRGGVA